MTEPIPQRPPASRWVGRRLVKTRFQLKFSLAVFALMTLFMALSWYLGARYVDHLASSGLIPKSEVGTQMKVLVYVMVRSSLLSWILVFGVSLLFSHFVAGPVFRFERIMREVQMGDISHRVKLRPYDELQDLAREMDGALAQIRARVGREAARRERLTAELEQLAARARAAGVSVGDAEKLISLEKNTFPEFKLPSTD